MGGIIAAVAMLLSYHRPSRAWATGVVGLEAVPRVLPPGAPLPCEGLPLVRYRGTHIRFQRPVRVHRDFAPKLEAFEKLVTDVAMAHYGRAPRRLRHLGGYNCRRMRRYPNWVSEHALGNALDVSGFAFGPLKTKSAAKLPRRLRRAFTVDVETHYRKKRGIAAHHARFLQALAKAVIERPDVFSVVLGPGWPGHENHFHFDAAPYRVIEIDLD